MVKGNNLIMESFTLRPIEIEDARYIYEWKNDSEIFKYLGGGYAPQSLADINNNISFLVKQSTSTKRFIIIHRETAEPVGLVGLYDINMVHRTCEIGIYIGNKKFQKRGAASIAVNRIENYAKQFLNLRKIILFVVSENKSAVKFWKKHNYQHVGTLTKHRYIDGKYADVELREKFL
ncbi:GNAT family N-acetyltransferase [Enterococcus dispar]|nr:GNAT family protein [Enterococcus dispar]